MIETVSNCVGCETCTKYNPCTQDIHRCDNCNRIISHNLYNYNGTELCFECCSDVVRDFAMDDVDELVRNMFSDFCEYFDIEVQEV